MPKKNRHEATMRSVQDLLSRIDALLSRVEFMIARSEETREEVLAPIARPQGRVPGQTEPRTVASRARPFDSKLAPRAVAKRRRPARTR